MVFTAATSRTAMPSPTSLEADAAMAYTTVANPKLAILHMTEICDDSCD
jgi:hypothetical protein